MNQRLKHVADIRISNVDKKSYEGQRRVRLCNYTDVYYNERIDSSKDFREATASDDQVRAFGLKPEDVVLTKDSEIADDIGVSTLIAEPIPDLVCGYHLAIVRPHPRHVHGTYLRWALATVTARKQMSVAATGVTRFGLRSDAISALELPVPPLSSQRAIAGFLDRATAEIDRLIAAKRRLADLLAERRHAAREQLVEAATSAGKLIRLGRLLTEVDERLAEAPPPQLFSVSIHHGVVPYADANPDRQPRAEELHRYKKCRQGDIVLNRMRAFQGGIGLAPSDGIVSPDYAVLRPAAGVSPSYLSHLMRSPWFVGKMERILRGIGGVDQGNVRTPRVNWADLRLVEVPAPPLDRQESLVASLVSSLEICRQGEERLATQIELLQERRQALITAAVTGQLDIPEVA